VKYSLPSITSAIFGRGKVLCSPLLPLFTTVGCLAAPWSAIFWQGCVEVSRCMPHHPVFFWLPLCIYTAHFVYGVANVSKTAPWCFTVAFPCLYMVLCLLWPMDASFVQSGECPPFMGPCRVILQLHPMAFFVHFLRVSLHTIFELHFCSRCDFT